MKIIRNYILRESIIPFFIALGVLTFIFLLGNLLQLTNLVINKGIGLMSVGKIFVLYIPVLLEYTLPIACLVSIILTFSRLSNDNEILAMRANGIHLWSLLAPLLSLGLIVSLITIILNERIIPYAYYQQQKLLKNLGVENPTALLEAGIFIHSFNNQILFIHKIDDNRLENITIYQPQTNGPTRTIIAKRGEFTPVPGKDQVKLKLIEGTSDEPDAGNPNNFYKVNFQNYFITLDLSKGQKKVEKKPRGMTLRELQDEIRNLRNKAVDPTRLVTEFHRKLSWSFSPLIFVLIGFPIAVITHRREKSANIVLAIICAAVYYFLSLGCEALSIKNLTPPQIAMWIPNITGLITGSFFNYRCAS